MIRSIARGLLVAALCSCLTSAPTSVAARDFLVKVGTPAGSLADSVARLVARHIGRFLPDGPSVIVQNVPGAGSLVLAKTLQNTEPTDGSVIAIIPMNIVLSTVIAPGQTGVAGDGFRWIGSLSEEPGLCMVRNDIGIDTIDDFRTKSFKLAATTKTSTAYVEAALVRNLLNAKFDIVTGFAGGAEANLAITRGEIQGGCGVSLYTFMQSDFSRDKHLIAYLGPAPRGDYAKLDLSSISDLVSSDRDRRAYELLTGVKQTVHAFAAPPKTPDAVVESLRSAFDQMISDPAFLVDAANVVPVIAGRTGKQVEAIAREIVATDPDTVDAARKLIQ